MTDESIAEDLRALAGFDAIFGVTDWRSPDTGDACSCTVGDARRMGDSEDIEAEARALAAKRAREREVDQRARAIELTEATKARQAARPRWVKIAMPVLAVVVMAVLGAAIATGKPGEHPLDTIARWFTR